jgi:hypothetical protein
MMMKKMSAFAYVCIKKAFNSALLNLNARFKQLKTKELKQTLLWKFSGHGEVQCKRVEMLKSFEKQGIS